MKHMRYLFVFLWGIFLYGCSEKNHEIKFINKIVCDSEKNVSVKDSASVGQNFNLWDWKIGKDIAVLRTSEANDFIKVYAYPEFKLLYTFGQQGHGADEFVTHNWCKTKKDGEFSVYDIMKRSLYVFSIDNDTVVRKQAYKLSENEDGLCYPYTLMLKLNDSLFLMKEDFDKTVLHLTNVKSQRDLSDYLCYYREENGGNVCAYTAYDYDFEVIGDKVLLAYRHADRMEILQISPTLKLVPVVIMGDRTGTVVDNDVYIDVCTNEKNFYILKCTNIKERRGNELVVISKDGNVKQKILLDKEFNTVQFDMDGNLVGYVELEQGGIFYRYDKSHF